jgi:hypothetical protein
MRSGELPFQEVLSNELLSQTIEALEYRDRVFTPDMTIFAFLAQVMGQDQSCASIEVAESVFRDDKKLYCFRPFSVFSGVHSRGYSSPLQRVVVDFGADHPFAIAIDKIKEHYGIVVPKKSVRLLIEFHGKQMMSNECVQDKKGVAQEVIIAQTDGCMVPLVEYEKPDDSATPIFDGTMGTSAESLKQLKKCVQRVGFDKHSYVHGVGDGATWIVNQVEEAVSSCITGSARNIPLGAFSRRVWRNHSSMDSDCGSVDYFGDYDSMLITNETDLKDFDGNYGISEWCRRAHGTGSRGGNSRSGEYDRSC